MAKKYVEVPFLFLGACSLFLPPSIVVPLPTALFAVCQLLPMVATEYPNEKLSQVVDAMRMKENLAKIVASIASLEVSALLPLFLSLLLCVMLYTSLCCAAVLH